MKAVLDTDVIICLLTGDDPAKQGRAKALFEAAAAGGIDLFVTATALADALFVLTSPRLYGVSREAAAEMLSALLSSPGVHLEHERRMFSALSVYRETSLDFGDAYAAAAAMDLEDPLVYSFDRDFDRLTGVRRLEP